MADVIPFNKSSSEAGYVQPAITYTEEDVNFARTAIASGRADTEEAIEKNKSQPVIESPSLFSDPLGWLMGWLNSVSQRFMEETETKIEGNAQYRAEQHLAKSDPAFAEALRREDGVTASAGQSNAVQDLAAKFQQENLADTATLRFDGDEGNKSMHDASPYIPKAPSGVGKWYNRQRDIT